ncbi:AsnC family transcriptional regulator [Actinomadura graeca]|uniref:AsnC family transcriptional regulator n=1 Tax=Actinomadura graeca TaxID=2750812 RepID=A0ABX8QV71_9ACTN|nr:AsnC family transcriptional regulator [Actinomadura graeca]QXJ22633.1 AsnC family transcriptional regulator [Actinomadura graeca]
MKSATTDGLDRQLLHALAIDGRAPFRRIAPVLGVSDQTVARRYHRLHSTGSLQVLGRLDTRRSRRADWLIRLHCTPGAAMPIADALARRSDTSWVTIISGGTEVLCVTQTRTRQQRDELLLDKLTRTSRVVSVAAHCVLHTFLGRPTPWSGILTALTPDQEDELRPSADQPSPVTASEFGAQPGDEALLELLARDGRAGYGELAAATGWSQSTVKRRLDHLRASGALYFDLDYDAALFGIEMTARLWMSVTPWKLAAVGAALAEHPETAFVGATTGPANLTATVLCADADALYDYLTMRVGRLRSVRSIETTPIIRTVKRAGVPRRSAS